MHQIRQVLKEEYLKRKSKNSKYSLRAFAKYIGISSTFMHDTIHGNRNLSKEKIISIAKKLKLDEQKYLTNNEPITLKETEFSQICHWYHFTILNLLEIPSTKKKNIRWISEKLELEESTVKSALDDLLKLKLINLKNKTYSRSVSSIQTTNNIPMDAIKFFHSENLYRAEKTMYNEPVENRHITSITAAINKQQYVEIKKAMQKFLTQISKIVEKETQTDRVYTFAVQLFPQSKEHKS